LAPQTPFVQVAPLPQSMGRVHEVLHFVPLSSHRNGKQVCVVPGMQTPFASHREASMTFWTWQRASAQGVPTG